MIALGRHVNQPGDGIRKRPRAFTLVELLVVIGIIGLLVSILLPSLQKARRSAKTLQCLSILRQFGNAQVQYAGAWKNWACPGQQFMERWSDNNGMRRFLGVKAEYDFSSASAYVSRNLICPEAYGRYAYQPVTFGPNNTTQLHLSYSYNTLRFVSSPGFLGLKIGKVRRPAEKVMFCDGVGPTVADTRSNHYMNPRFPDYTEAGENNVTRDYPAFRHSKAWDKINIVFWDNHAETRTRWDVATAGGWQDNENRTHANFSKVWDNTAP